jgi:crotonobetainyl-CoA:carnitine CoA-transferase CaiB-like acyl-CoA transferase
VAIYQSMRTADRTIVIALGNDNHWQRACAALGLDHLAEREELRTNAGRRAHRRELVTEIQARLERMPSSHVLKLLQDVSVPCAPINYLSEVVSDPQVVARRAIVDYEHPVAGAFRGVGAPWRLASDPADRQARLPAPLRGEHGREILLEIGLEDEAIDELTEESVVWIP